MTTLSQADVRYLKALSDLDWHSVTELAAKWGTSSSGVGRHFSRLVARKLVAFQAPDFYAITKAGQTASANHK